VGWVGLGELFGGLGWAGSMKIDPRTTLIWAMEVTMMVMVMVMELRDETGS